MNRRVGFCLSDKKRKRMNLAAFAELCQTRGIEVVEIDLSQPLDLQGPFSIIVHKLSDVIVEAEHSSQSQELLANFEKHVAAHPLTVLLDPLPAMRQLLDRFVSYHIMNRLHDVMADPRICSPPYLEISTADQREIRDAVAKQQLSYPLNRKTIFFNSHEVSKPESSSHLTALDEGTALPRPPSDEVISAMVTELRAELGMSLFGVDVIVNNETERLTVIDINIFPSYEGVPQFFSALLAHIEAVLGSTGSGL
nr:PREDICTED: inositol-tetrakisphosphate 1-kinase-like isoform X1 [Lepisosteus oculatus]XP_015196186.1 PREDICTED: inositol-tetrakisphosphate 1-kinase-like isoform X1 [Lepisosteus oculatus]